MRMAILCRCLSAQVLLLCGCLVAGLVEASSPPPERIPWQKMPIAVEIPIGVERAIEFPGPVTVGIPEGLQGAVRVQSIAGTVYLLAQRAFAETRVVVRRLDAAAVYVLDIAAVAGDAAAVPVVIFHPDNADEATRESSSNDEPARYGYVTLTRFAAQQLYAPTRLLESLSGIVRVPVRGEPVTLVRGAAVEATPLIAWRAGELHVTAVKLTNQSRVPHVLDPRDLRGRWLAATFQHNRLLPAGDEADLTVVYLISNRPFAASL